MISLTNETPENIIFFIKSLLDSNKLPFIIVDNEKVGVVKSIKNNTLSVEFEEEELSLRYISVNLLKLDEVKMNSIFTDQNEISVYPEKSVIHLLID